LDQRDLHDERLPQTLEQAGGQVCLPLPETPRWGRRRAGRNRTAYAVTPPDIGLRKPNRVSDGDGVLRDAIVPLTRLRFLRPCRTPYGVTLPAAVPCASRRVGFHSPRTRTRGSCVIRMRRGGWVGDPLCSDSTASVQRREGG
jgi:hypothetical protein